MPLTDLLLQQLGDVFRIGLIIGLIYTAFRTRGNVSIPVALGMGIFFIALMIPMTLPPTGLAAAEPLWRVAAVGVVANVILVALGLAAWSIVLRFRK